MIHPALELIKSKDVLYIPLNVPSSKNSRVTIKETGKNLPSKLTQAYYKRTKVQYQLYAKRFKEIVKGWEKPYDVGFFFIRADKRSFDWVGPLETVQDQMTKCKVIDDDSIHDIIPFCPSIGGARFLVDKKHAGVLIIPKLFKE